MAHTEPGHDSLVRQAHQVDRVDTPGHREYMVDRADRARIQVGPGMVASRQ